MQLVRKDNSCGVRIAEIYIEWCEDYNIIKRKTGLLNGTMTPQPDIEVYSGKANRTVEEQTHLEYNSMLQDYLDKGYKPLTDYGIEASWQITSDIYTKIATTILNDSNNVPKAMLAKIAFDKRDRRFNKLWYSSFKIDGVRCMIRYDSVNKCLLTASRGGKDFSYSTKHICENEVLLQIFKEHPSLVLDGELYIHGKSLPFISGLSRMKYYNAEIHAKLDFYVFDIVVDKQFTYRLEILKSVELALRTKALLLDDMSILDTVRFVKHEDTYSHGDVMEMHDRAIEEGYEGVVLRDPDGMYGYGSRDWRMIKIKMFDDAEFTITGMTDGLRPEDMVFVLNSHNGKSFEAKPVGSRMLREHYRNNIHLYIGKKGCVKYFGFTPYGIPNLPTFKYVREDE
jgi:DNA ligase-1